MQERWFTASLRGLRGAGRAAQRKGKGGVAETRDKSSADSSSDGEESAGASTAPDEDNMEASDGREVDETGRMVQRDDIVTAEQCIGHAEAALEEGEYEDAVDFVQAALEDVADEYGADAPESVPLLLLYSRALMAMETQAAAEIAELENPSSGSGGGTPQQGDADGDGDSSSGPEEATHAAWRVLEDAQRILHQCAGRETKELADTHELKAQYALNTHLTCPIFAGKTRVERRAIALTHLRECLRIRASLYPPAHEAVDRVRAEIATCEGAACGAG